MEAHPPTYVAETQPQREETCNTETVPCTEVDELSALLGAVSLQTPIKPLTPVTATATASASISAPIPALSDQIESEDKSVSDNNTVSTSEEAPESSSKESPDSGVGVALPNETVAPETDTSSNKIEETNTAVPAIDEASLTNDSEIEFNIPEPTADSETALNDTIDVDSDKALIVAETNIQETCPEATSTDINEEIPVTEESKEPAQSDSSVEAAPRADEIQTPEQSVQEEVPQSSSVPTSDEVQVPESSVSSTEVTPETVETLATEEVASWPQEEQEPEVVAAKSEEVSAPEVNLSEPDSKAELPPEPGSPPLVPKGSYNIDFDSIDLENFNPFGTKSKVVNYSALPGPPPEQPKPVAEKASPKAATPKKVTPKKSPKKVSPKKPSPEKKEPQVSEALAPNPEEAIETTPEVPEVKTTQPESVPTTEPQYTAEPESPPLLSKGSYNIDFDSIDLENFNPFGTKSKVRNDGALPGSPEQPQSTNVKTSPKVAKTEPSTRKATPKKVTPKKTPPKKASPKKPSPNKLEEELDDSFHDAVEEVPRTEAKSSEVSKDYLFHKPS